MSICLSRFLADVSMNKPGTIKILTGTHPGIKLWLRYVDDLFVVLGVTLENLKIF